MSPPPAQHASAEAERLFAQYLAQRELGEEVALESLCASHPEHASELRLLNADWESFGGVLEHLGLSGSLLARSNFATLDLDLPGRPVEVEDVEDSASKVAARIAARSHPYRRYRIQGEVGRGGMGAILRARDEDLRRDVVLKVARPGRNPDRFLEEAQVGAQLDHPGIVPVHEIALDDSGRFYFTMKLVKGRDLRKVFDLVWEEQEGWSRNGALRVMLKVCEAVAYAHDKRVVHRDLKPHNIMVGRFGEVFVMDWGLARVLGPRPEPEPEADETPPSFYTTRVRSDRAELSAAEPDSPFATLDGTAVGTPAYMPPEQALGRRHEVGVRSDIYSLGAILYQLLTRRMPYVDPDELVTSRVILDRVRTTAPSSVRTLAPDVDPALAAIVDQAMARDPLDRHADALELAQELSAWLDGQAAAPERTRGRRAALGLVLLSAAGVAVALALWLGTRSELAETRDAAADVAGWVLEHAPAEATVRTSARELRAER